MLFLWWKGHGKKVTIDYRWGEEFVAILKNVPASAGKHGVKIVP